MCSSPGRGGSGGEWRGGGSYLLDLLADDDGVVPADLLRAHLPVVERAVVLVAVPVHRAEEAAASALEPRQADLLATRGAPVLLLLAVAAVILAVLVLVVGRTGARAVRTPCLIHLQHGETSVFAAARTCPTPVTRDDASRGPAGPFPATRY